jgi:hypothetical protein
MDPQGRVIVANGPRPNKDRIGACPEKVDPLKVGWAREDRSLPSGKGQLAV